MAWAPDYATTAELKTFARITGSADDTVLALAITAASRAIDRHTGRQFGVVASAEERFYTARLDRRPWRTLRYRAPRWVVDVDDLMSTTSLTVKVGEVTVTTFTKEPVNAAVLSRPWTEIVLDSRSEALPCGRDNEISVTALWGWSAVPDTIKQATLLQASRLFSRRTSPFGVAGSPDLGSELRLLAKVDADVAVVLEEYVRHWGAV